MDNNYRDSNYRDSEYRAAEGFKTDKNASRNRLRLNYPGGSCDILQYSMIYKISYDGSGNIFMVYSDGVYQISGKNLDGLVEMLQSEIVSAIIPIEDGQTAPEGKPVIHLIEHLDPESA